MNDIAIAYKYLKIAPSQWANIVSWLLFNPAELAHRYQEEVNFQANMKQCWWKP